MRLELISIPTDTEALAGLLWQPDGQSKGAVLICHGNTNNFYSGPSAFLPPRLVGAGYTCLAFNRRGHDVIVTLEGKRMGGGAFQTAAEGIADNEYAAAFLAGRGLPLVVVAGHSNGGMLAARYAADHPELPALVLLSAHAGGPDIYLRTCAAGRMAGDRAREFLDRARELVADGRGDELILMPGWWFAISAASLVDRHENTPDTLADAERISCRSLFLVGSLESRLSYPAEEFARRSPGSAQWRVIDGADHWYTGLHEPVADLVAEWLG